MGNLAAKSKTWQQIREKLLNRSEIGEQLELVCQIHHSVTQVSNGKEFRQKSPEGGCSVMCHTGLKCGHICQSVSPYYQVLHNKALYDRLVCSFVCPSVLLFSR